MAGRVIEIAGRKVGEGYPPIISAEVGLNHNGDMGIAIALMFEAKRAGCDAVKFQNYSTADFVKNRYTTYDNGHGFSEPMWSLCQRCELAYEDLALLKHEADKLGIIFHSTPTSREGVDDLVKLGVPVLKNGADYWENEFLGDYMLEQKIPCVFSTAKGHGYSDLWTDEAHLHPSLIVLHTVREYPAKDWNKERFYLLQSFYPLVGYSDHTIGVDAAIEAARLGAVWIEFHLTLEKTLPGPDHWYSKDPNEVSKLVKAIRGME